MFYHMLKWHRFKYQMIKNDWLDIVLQYYEILRLFDMPSHTLEM